MRIVSVREGRGAWLVEVTRVVIPVGNCAISE